MLLGAEANGGFVSTEEVLLESEVGLRWRRHFGAPFSAATRISQLPRLPRIALTTPLSLAKEVLPSTKRHVTKAILEAYTPCSLPLNLQTC